MAPAGGRVIAAGRNPYGALGAPALSPQGIIFVGGAAGWGARVAPRRLHKLADFGLSLRPAPTAVQKAPYKVAVLNDALAERGRSDALAIAVGERVRNQVGMGCACLGCHASL